jgi:hypothetical protein
MIYIIRNLATLIMWFFAPTQFLKPSEWLRAVPLVQDKIWELSIQDEFGMNSAQDLVDWSKVLLAILKKEEQLRNIVHSYQELQKEEPWYPIRVNSRLFTRLEQLLLIAEGKMIPLSEEQLRQVRANANSLI